MKRIIVLFILNILIFGVIHLIASTNAFAIDAPYLPPNCASGYKAVEVGTEDVVCIPEDVSYLVDDKPSTLATRTFELTFCKHKGFKAQTFNKISGINDNGCCPDKWVHFNSAAILWCCPPEYPASNILKGVGVCIDSNANEFDFETLAQKDNNGNVLLDDKGERKYFINGESVLLDIHWVLLNNSYHYLSGSYHAFSVTRGKNNGKFYNSHGVDTPNYPINNKYSNIIAYIKEIYPYFKWIPSSDRQAWCSTQEYYCLYKGETLNGKNSPFGPSFSWDYTSGSEPFTRLYKSSDETPSGYPPTTNYGNLNGVPTCARTCSSITLDPAITNVKTATCLPQIGFVVDDDTWKKNLKKKTFIDPDGGGELKIEDFSTTQDLKRKLCKNNQIKQLLPAGLNRNSAAISGCAHIIEYKDSNDAIQTRDPDKFKDLYVEYNKCSLCEGNHTGNLWTGIGCIEPTSNGIINRIFQIAVGIIGGVIILRIIQAVFLLNFSEPSPDREAEVRDIFVSIVSFLIVTTGAVMLLRFLLINILGYSAPLLFS